MTRTNQEVYHGETQDCRDSCKLPELQDQKSAETTVRLWIQEPEELKTAETTVATAERKHAVQMCLHARLMLVKRTVCTQYTNFATDFSTHVWVFFRGKRRILTDILQRRAPPCCTLPSTLF